MLRADFEGGSSKNSGLAQRIYIDSQSTINFGGDVRFAMKVE